MKSAIIIFGLALTFLLSGLVGQTPEPTPLPIEPSPLDDSRTVYIGSKKWPLKTIFRGGVNNDEWLVVTRHKSSEGDRNFDPCFTDITSDFRPVVQKDGAKWRIIFETRDITTEFVP